MFYKYFGEMKLSIVFEYSIMGHPQGANSILRGVIFISSTQK